MNKEFSIDYWRVDPKQGLLQGEQQSKKLEPKAMALLLVLAKAEGKLVSREEIIKAVWPDQVVSDYALNTLIANLRKNLADHDDSSDYIETRPKLGYKLAVEVVWHGTSADIEKGSTTIDSDNNEQTIVSVSTDNKSKSRFSRFFAFAISLVSLAAIAIKFFPVAPSSTPSSSLITNPSIAVLPFDVFDGEADTGYFADGLAEEIIHQLAAVPELNVISRTASFSFRGKQANVDEIAQKLKVDYLVEGSVRSDAESMRITVQLIKTADASHQWSKVFSAAGDGIISLQEQISQAVVSSLSDDRYSLKAKHLRSHSLNSNAYQHYLKGMAFMGLSTAHGYENAMPEFTAAIEIDPNYALAHAAMAMTHILSYQYLHIPLKTAGAKAQHAIDKALEIDPDLTDAHVARGLYYTYAQEFSAAEPAFKKALENNPSSLLAHHNLGFMYWYNMEYNKALQSFKKALGINPLAPLTNFSVGDTLIALGELEKSFKQFEYCHKLLPEYFGCGLGLANLYRLTNQLDKSDKLVNQYNEKNAVAFYLNTAKAAELLIKEDFTQAEIVYEQLLKHNNNAYDLLRELSRVKWHLGKSESWLAYLQNALVSNPDNKNYLINAGLTAYYLGNCELSLGFYEKVFDNKMHNVRESRLAEIALGISHAANMAYCYQQTNQIDNKNQRLAILKDSLTQFKIGNYQVPGVDYVKAKYARLTADPETEKSLIAKIIKQKWTIFWQYKIEPIFTNVTSYEENSN